MMNIKLIFYVFFLFFTFPLFSQKRDYEIKYSDTVTVTKYIVRGVKHVDSVYHYDAILCEIESYYGIRFDLGISNYYYGDKTIDFLGKHISPNLNVAFVVKNLSVGIKLKPWRVYPQKLLEFNEIILPKTANLNIIKVDYFAGYSFDFDWNIALEPYIGYSQSIFDVINEDELEQKYSIPSTGGFIAGATVNKYFKISHDNFFAIYSTIGYAFVDYSKVHKALDNDYIDWSIGISYKGFFKKRFYKKVD